MRYVSASNCGTTGSRISRLFAERKRSVPLLGYESGTRSSQPLSKEEIALAREDDSMLDDLLNHADEIDSAEVVAHYERVAPLVAKHFAGTPKPRAVPTERPRSRDRTHRPTP